MLRIIGGSVLLLGGGIGGLVYWLGARSASLMDDPAMLGFNRANQRQMNALFGKSGGLIEDLATDLKQPGTQAFLILTVSIIIAVACFYFASRLVSEDESVDKTGSSST